MPPTAPAALAALVAAFDAAKTANPTELANVSIDATGAITSTDATLTIGGTLANVTGATAATTNGTPTVPAGTQKPASPT